MKKFIFSLTFSILTFQTTANAICAPGNYRYISCTVSVGQISSPRPAHQRQYCTYDTIGYGLNAVSVPRWKSVDKCRYDSLLSDEDINDFIENPNK